jgi:hypothetical protein
VEVKESDEEFPNHIYIKEVVREPRLKFFKVPKLGAYLSTQLSYNSCLFEEALDHGFEDFKICHDKRIEQEKERKEYDERALEEKEQKESNGEEWIPDDKEWDDIRERDFDVTEEKYVVCMDTLGQDKEFLE